MMVGYLMWMIICFIIAILIHTDAITVKELSAKELAQTLMLTWVVIFLILASKKDK